MFFPAAFPTFGCAPIPDDGLGGSLTDTIVNILNTAGKLGTSYWSNQTAVAQQQALYDAAKAGTAQQQAALLAQQSAAQNINNYIPYIIGGVALVTLAIVMTRSK